MGFHQIKRWVSRNIATDAFAIEKSKLKDSFQLVTGLWSEKEVTTAWH